MTTTIGQLNETTAAALTVDTRELRAAVADAAKIAATGPRTPLNGLLLHTANDGLRITGSNGQTWLTRRVDYVGDAIPRVLVGARLLADTVKLHDNAGRTIITAEDQHVTVGQGRRVLRLRRLPTDDYPSPPPTPRAAFELSNDQLTRIADRVAVAATNDQTVPMLTCIRLEVGDGRLGATATDRHRLVTQHEQVPDYLDGDVIEVSVPVTALRQLTKTLRRTDTATIGVDGEHLVASTPDASFGLKLVTGETYPRPRKPFPRTRLRITADRAALLTELKAVMLAVEGSTPVRLTACGDELILQAGSDDAAVAASRVPVDGGPREPFTIAFNPVYLAAALKSSPGERVTAGFASPTAPAQLTSQTEKGFRHVLMPVRISG